MESICTSTVVRPSCWKFKAVNINVKSIQACTENKVNTLCRLQPTLR